MRRLSWLLGLVLVPIACSTGGELFGEGETTKTSSASGTGGTTVSSSRSATSTSVQASSSTGGSAPASSAEASSTASGGVMAEIPCTTQTCTMGLVCCVHPFNDNLDTCAAPGACDRGYVEVACNGPNDCAPSEVCCGTFIETEGYQFIACQPSCNDSSTTLGITMCGDDPNTCPSQQGCYPSGFLPSGHSFCQ